MRSTSRPSSPYAADGDVNGPAPLKFAVKPTTSPLSMSTCNAIWSITAVPENESFPSRPNINATDSPSETGNSPLNFPAIEPDQSFTPGTRVFQPPVELLAYA